ncbi:Rpn family recombination-promoting nuclease/putative transposase, partial [Yersinia mollaretii]|uniref:Rpn family recombination-promoting nuclease/putative transposase n=1 Tax=Yersinia mollaretii TaxID=33060 RepID=UPI0011A0C87C
MTHKHIAVLELLQKHIRRRDVSELLKPMVTQISKGYMTKDQLISVIHYLLQNGETAEPERFILELVHYLPQYEGELMTIAQKLEQNGLQKGIQKGRQEGILIGEANGLKKAALKIACTMLANGLDRATVMKMTSLSEEELTQIQH